MPSVSTCDQPINSHFNDITGNPVGKTLNHMAVVNVIVQKQSTGNFYFDNFHKCSFTKKGFKSVTLMHENKKSFNWFETFRFFRSMCVFLTSVFVFFEKQALLYFRRIFKKSIFKLLLMLVTLTHQKVPLTISNLPLETRY